MYPNLASSAKKKNIESSSQLLNQFIIYYYPLTSYGNTFTVDEGHAWISWVLEDETLRKESLRCLKSLFFSLCGSLSKHLLHIHVEPEAKNTDKTIFFF